MVHWLMRSAVLALVTSQSLGCGGDSASESSGPTAVSAVAPTSSAAPASAQRPPPEVQLTWLPGGTLALENADTQPVSLAREVSLQVGEEQPERLQLGLGCATTEAPTPGQAERACLTLVPGAALAIGRWPDDHGACRCPPCVEVREGSSFVIHTCDQGHALSRSLPER